MATRVTLWYQRETDADYLYSKTPPGREVDQVWVPKSIVEHRSKNANQHIVTLPEWFVRKEGL